MAPTFKGCGEKHIDDLQRQSLADDARTDRQHIGVVVFARHPRGVQAVAERGSHPPHLVRSQLFTLPATTQHDSNISLAIANRSRGGRTELWVVDTVKGVGAVIDHRMTGSGHVFDETLFEGEAGMIGSEGNGGHGS